MLKQIKKIEVVVSILVLLILLNYFAMFISYNEYVIKLIFCFYICVILFFIIYKPLNFFHLKITLVILMIIVLGNPTYAWDAWAVWLFHAKRIFLEQSIIAQLDGYAAWSHNDYPVIAPAFAASFATFIGGWNNIFPKLAFLLMFFPPLILSIRVFNTKYNLLFLILVLFILDLQLVFGLVDGLVAIYFTFSSYLIYEIFVSKQNSFYWLFIAFCFLIILALLKNEGIVLASILLTTMIIINILKKKLLQNYKKIIFLLFSIIPVLIWKITCNYYNIENDIINYNSMNNFLKNMFIDDNSFKLIFKLLLLDTKFILSTIFILLVFYFTKNKKIFYYVLFLGMSYLLSLIIIFLITPNNLAWQLSGGPRIILSLTCLFAFFGILQIYYKNMKIYDL